MQVTKTIAAAPVVKQDETTGARIGDKVLFSPHHVKNDTYLFNCNITANKLYEVVKIAGKKAVLINDKGGETLAGAFGHIGHYDIIERAPEPEPVKPEFQPVILTLETQGEVNLFISFVGSLKGSVEQAFDAPIPLSVWEKFRSMESESRPHFKAVEIE